MHYRDAGHGSFTGALGSDEKKPCFVLEVQAANVLQL